MKLFRKILRYWIGIASVLSFLGGWVILAHSPKPVQPQSSSASVPPIILSTIPPIQAYGGTSNNGPTFFSTTAPGNSTSNNVQPNQPVQPIQPIQPVQSVPLLRTRGS